MTEPIVTGTDLLRAKLKAWGRKTNLSQIAQDVGTSTSDLEAFANGEDKLKTEVLQKLTTMLFSNAEFVPELDRMRVANRQEPKLLGIPPEPYVPPPNGPKYVAGVHTSLYPPDNENAGAIIPH